MKFFEEKSLEYFESFELFGYFESFENFNLLLFY